MVGLLSKFMADSIMWPAVLMDLFVDVTHIDTHDWEHGVAGRTKELILDSLDPTIDERFPWTLVEH